MSLFEFVVGMISVILALAAAQLFVGVGELMQRRARVRFFLPQCIWIINLFMLTFVHWWSLWDFRDLSWNFAMFFYSLLGPSLMFFAATTISPRDQTGETIDLMEHFLNIRQFFFSVFIAMLILFTFDGLLFGTEEPLNALRAAQAVVVAMGVWGLVSKSPRVHLVVSLAVLTAVFSVTFIRFLPG